MTPEQDLSIRFGHPDNYEELFTTMEYSLVKQDFENFESNKTSKNDKYENSRQQFLKLLGQHKMIWYPTNQEVDMDVDVSRIYRHDRHEYLAFMRIMPRGFRAERTVPGNVEMVFHVLTGRVIFHYRRKTRTLTRGQFINVAPRSTYAIRTLTEDEPAYLIFRVINNVVKKRREPPPAAQTPSRPRRKSALITYEIN